MHELGHAVTHFTANLEYQNQSGALNESVSDVFAIMAVQYQAKTASGDPNAIWRLAENIWTKDPKGALRDFKAPGAAFKFTLSTPHGDVTFVDTQVKHMRDYQPTQFDRKNDHGGVHRFSGIPNHAFYLASTQIGGFSWEKPGKIWYQALLKAQQKDDFVTFAGRTIQAAKDLSYGEPIQALIYKAWSDVGLDLRRVHVPTARL